MLLLPSLDVRNSEHEILILGGFARAIDHAGASDEIARIDRIDGVVGPVAAGNPMDWRIEMRTRMLAATEVVPVPFSAATLVVTRDLLDLKRCALPELRRQHQRRKVRRQGLGEIDDAEAGARDVVDEIRQIAHREILCLGEAASML